MIIETHKNLVIIFSMYCKITIYLPPFGALVVIIMTQLFRQNSLLLKMTYLSEASVYQLRYIKYYHVETEV